VRRSATLVATIVALLAAVLAGSAAARPPRIGAREAVLVEASTGRVLYARHAYRPAAIASTTKLMTVLLALERARPSDVVVAPPYFANPAESKLGLQAGERITIGDLVRATLLPSANDAANALAVRIGGTRQRFVALMNARARQLGLRATHYTTPVGLDSPGNHSSALDLARLAIVLRYRPFARRVMDLPRAVLRSGARTRVVVNRNTLVRRVPWVDGVKTGHTLQAGYVLVGAGRRRRLSVVSVVMGTPSEAARDADSLALLSWGVDAFDWVTPVRRGSHVGRAGVVHDDEVSVPLVAARGVRRLVHRSARIRTRLDVPRELEGPLPRRAIVGTLTVRAGRRVLGRVNVLTGSAVPEVGLLERFRRALGPLGTLVVAVLVVGLVALMVRNRQMARRRRRARRPRRPAETA
jgi:D-alanyl-D-alanine carboxypeptidase (penicillin-binding protein 5/6)